MTSTPPTDPDPGAPVDDLGEALGAAVAQLRSLGAAARSSGRLGDEQLVRALVAYGALARTLSGIGLSLASSVEERCRRDRGMDGLAAKHGQRSAKALVAVMTGCSETTAAKTLAVAKASIPRPATDGSDGPPPPFPLLGQALLDGRVHEDAGSAIVRTLERSISRIDPDDLALAESALIEAASDAQGPENALGHVSDTGLPADVVRDEARRWQVQLDPEGVEKNERAAFEQRGLVWRRTRFGGERVEITLTAEAAATVKEAISAATDPRRVASALHPDASAPDGWGLSSSSSSSHSFSFASSETSETETESAGETGTEPNHSDTLAGEPLDAPRSPEQRSADVVVALISAGARSQALVGSTPDIVAVVHADDLAADEIDPSTGAARLDFTDTPITALAARRLACFGTVTVAVTGSHGEITRAGSPQRLFSRAQRRLLAARDGGCAWRTCTAPPAWTEAHHVEWFSRGGRTSIDNGVLLCSFHHHVVHEGEWRIVMHSSEHGARPHLIAPPYVDPTQRPRPMGRGAPTSVASRLPRKRRTQDRRGDRSDAGPGRERDEPDARMDQ